jgi:hypothetical protein
MQQILRIELVFHTQRGSIFPTKSQLPSDGVEPRTECLDEFKRVRSGLRRRSCGLLVRGGADRHRGMRLRMRWDGRRFLPRMLWPGGGNWIHDGRWFPPWWLRWSAGMCRSGLRGLWSLWWRMRCRRGELSHRLRWGGRHRRRGLGG